MLRNLVFSGGGIKGAAYAGAVRQLHEYGLMQDIGKVAGASAGAITALAVACGYTPDELDRMVFWPKYSELKDDSPGIFRDLYRFYCKYGLYKGEILDMFVKGVLRMVDLPADLTFHDLACMEPTESRRYRELSVTVCNLSRQDLEIFDVTRTPDMPVAEAVRTSANIPLLWPPRKHRNMLYVDGGMADNYPVGMFDTEDERGHRVPDPETMGFFLGPGPRSSMAPVKVRSMKTAVTAVLSMLVEQVGNTYIESIDWERTVFIDPGDVQSTDFGLDMLGVQDLVTRGRLAVQLSPLVQRFMDDKQTVL